MKFSYYPGCTLSTKAKELDRFGRLSAEALGVQLEEIEQWQCCGAVYPQAEDEIATKLSAVRALNAGKEKGQKVLTLCSACHHVLKRVNDDMKNNEYIRTRANNYLKLDVPYAGESEVVHYLEMLRDDVGFAALKKAVKRPLKGVKIAAYYGCLLLRPSSVMAFDDPENPSIMEDFIRAIGATPVIYSQRNECCGAYMAMEKPEFAERRAETVLASARAAGADIVLTACPLCLYNLTKNAGEGDGKPQVKYFTELLWQALEPADSSQTAEKEEA